MPSWLPLASRSASRCMRTLLGSAHATVGKRLFQMQCNFVAERRTNSHHLLLRGALCVYIFFILSTSRWFEQNVTNHKCPFLSNSRFRDQLYFNHFLSFSVMWQIDGKEIISCGVPFWDIQIFSRSFSLISCSFHICFNDRF